MRAEYYAIYDGAVKAFMRPFLSRTVEEAVRTFGQAVRNPESDLARTPGDFALFKIGEFDDETGLLYPEKAPGHITNALAFVESGKVVGVTEMVKREAR